MQDEKIIKKESNLIYDNGKLFGKKKGSLVLTQNEIYFLCLSKKIFNIPLKNITNVRAKKGVMAGYDFLDISYNEEGKNRTKTIERRSYVNGLVLGHLDKIAEPFFRSWEKIIEDARLGKDNKSGSNYDEIEKLADMKNRGIITEEEFQTKKKQLLGI
ncbi:MAG: SHOCT domain-containing protein [Patescibacteria group bacterium]|nr:SHOCT domain-containing protein [Patescibacteria group bacterium]MDD4611049.1 SHOCT domain-containing protein [Patescibacteria group bacterium]